MMYKYIRGTNLLSNEIHNLLNTLENVYKNEVEIKIFFYDNIYLEDKNRFLLNDIITFNPNIFILSSYSANNIKQPSFSIVKYLKKILINTKLINIMWDSASLKTYKNYKKVFSISDLSAIIDGSNFYNNYKNRLNLLKLYAPQNSLLYFYDKNIKKDIDVLFLGSTISYRSIRKEYLNYLIKHNINIKFGGGSLEKPLTVNEYAKMSRKAKIIINFSFSADNQHQIKGRVFEALHCGCLLLESKNSITSSYLNPNKEYIEYDNKEDLVKKIKYYLQNDKERIKIALAGHNRVKKEYNEKIFWDTILDRLK